MTKTIKLTEKQIDTIRYAFQVFEDTVAGFPADEMREFGYNRDLAIMKRILLKLEGVKA